MNEDIDNGLEVDWDGEDHDDASDSHTAPLMDVLQTFGIDVVDATEFCNRVIKAAPICPTTAGNDDRPTLIELYGQGNIVQASHGPRRDLNLDGLRAFDLRTRKQIGEAWDFRNRSDRREARRLVDEETPTWFIGSPPCTSFSRWNQSLNHKKMDPHVVEELRQEAVQHLRFVIGLYKLQLGGGRHFLH